MASDYSCICSFQKIKSNVKLDELELSCYLIKVFNPLKLKKNVYTFSSYKLI